MICAGSSVTLPRSQRVTPGTPPPAGSPSLDHSQLAPARSSGSAGAAIQEACQSAGASRPVEKVAGALQPEAAPRSSQTCTFQW